MVSEQRNGMFIPFLRYSIPLPIPFFRAFHSGTIPFMRSERTLRELYLLQSSTGGRNNLPHTVNNTKLIVLSVSCDIRLWLPMIQSFSSLEQLFLRDEGESSSSAEPVSLSELYNLQLLELFSFTRFGSLFSELPPNLKELRLCNHATLTNLPALSDLKQLKRLDIIGYHSLESLPPLPPHLQSLGVYDCSSLQVPSDMSMLKELEELTLGRPFPEFGLKYIRNMIRFTYRVSYESDGHTLCCDIPPLLGDNFLGLGLWFFLKSRIKIFFSIKVVVTNETNGTAECYWIPVHPPTQSTRYCVARCISRDLISITSGDRIAISFERQLYTSDRKVELPYEQVKVVNCAAHVIEKTPFTPDFPSFFDYLINLPF